MTSPSSLDHQKPTRNPFSAFALRPAAVRLEVADSGEKIHLLLRRHTATNLPWILTTLVLILLPLFYLHFKPALIQLHPIFDIPSFFSAGLNLAIVLIYCLGVFLFALERFLNWYYTAFLITSERVLDIDLVGFLYKNVTEARLRQVQDISHVQGGIWQIIFNYGNVFVQTAGTAQDIEMLNVPRPAQVQDFLTDLIESKNDQP